MNPNAQRVEAKLQEVLTYLPIAIALGRLEVWARLYTEGYMLKLRAMR